MQLSKATAAGGNRLIMRTDLSMLRIGKADGSVLEVPMRYNASHQRGYRCYIGPLVHTPDQISEDTPRSFEGRSLFLALEDYRKTIEPEGWRLLHMAARRDCWPKPDRCDEYVQRLTAGVDETERLNGFDPADLDDVTTLAEQHANFLLWLQSLSPVHQGRVRPKAGHEHDAAGVEFSSMALTAGEYLVDGHPNASRILQSATKLRRDTGTRAPQ